MDSPKLGLHAGIMTAQTLATNSFGPALQRYRSARRLSQLELAATCDVSSRHLSFLESGRAQPSREMVERLSAGLMLPLGLRNTLLQAAGFAPVYPASPLSSDALEPFRAVLEEMISRHHPNPAMVVDKHWTVRDANATARALLSVLQDGSDEMSVPRLLATSAHAATAIINLPEVLDEFASRLQLEALEAGDDPVFADLLRLFEEACERHPRPSLRQRRPVLPVELTTPFGQMRFLSVIAHFGTSEDVTVRDLRLELLFPADEATRTAMQTLSATAR